MSTKIFNAYKFNGSMDDLMVHLRNYRKKWVDFQVNRLLGIYKHRDKGVDHWSLLTSSIREHSSKPFPSWSDLFDIRGSVAVYFHDGRIYVQTFLKNIVFENVTIPEFIDDRFIDFHYQNQCDPWYDCSDLSEEEKVVAAADWENRKKVWDDIFSDGLNSPVEAGLTYEFTSYFDYVLIANQMCTVIRSEQSENGQA